MFLLTIIYFVSVAIVGFVAVQILKDERDRKGYLSLGDLFFYPIAGLGCSFFPVLNSILALLIIFTTLEDIYKESRFSGKRFFEKE